MDIKNLTRIVTSFADRPADVDTDKGTLVAQIRDEVVEVQLSLREGQLFCKEGDAQSSSYTWVLERLARFQNLARRIIEFVPEDRLLIPVSAQITDVLDRQASPEPIHADDALTSTLNFLDKPPVGFTSVAYLTSDAGEGKTSIINAMAREQASRYLKKHSDWLLLPVALGGRPFIRLDDLVVGSLTNRLRFPFLYYDSVVELVKMGGLVLALDGFEEMFVESQVGDAVSSLGSLVSKLDSSGRVLIAARTAYYRYKQFETQAKLFRSLGESAVEFAEISLERWDRNDFLALARKCGMKNGESLYSSLSDRLTKDHPLLTRAVLARRLIEEFMQATEPGELLARLTNAKGEEYFEEFVSALLHREAHEKWIDRSGETARPLLSVNDHHTLLSQIAEEMWRSGTASLSPSFLELVAELVISDHLRHPGEIVHQAKERISQHALLRESETASNQLEFDHDDFRLFYLGRRVGELLRSAEGGEDLRLALQIGRLPDLAVRVAASKAVQPEHDVVDLCETLCQLAGTEGQVSHARDNCGQLSLALASGATNSRTLLLHDLHFSADSLSARSLGNICFRSCHFERTSLRASSISSTRFQECQMLHLEIERGQDLAGLTFDDKSVPIEVTLLESDGEESRGFFHPAGVREVLRTHGATLEVDAKRKTEEAIPIEEEEEIRLAERAIRQFQRATALNDSVLRLKLGTSEAKFFGRVLPALLQAGILREEQYKGAGNHHRFRLNAGFDEIAKARASCGGSFAKFLETLKRSAD